MSEQGQEIIWPNLAELSIARAGMRVKRSKPPHEQLCIIPKTGRRDPLQGAARTNADECWLSAFVRILYIPSMNSYKKTST